jgi:autotransporter translocation and assembly factor TamB
MWYRTAKTRLDNLKLRYKILLGFIMAWLYLFLIGYILLRSSDFRGYLKAKLIVELEKNLNANVAIGDISGNVFSWVRIRDVKVSGPRTPGRTISATPVKNQFTAELVMVRFSLWEALHGGIGFSNLQLTNPKFVFYTETLKTSRTLEPARGKPRLNLRWIQIVHAAVELHHLHKTYQFSSVNFAGSLNYDAVPSRLQLGIRKCSGWFAEIPIDELRGYLLLDNKRIEVRNLQVRGNNIHLQANGTIVGYHLYDPLVDFQITSDKLPLQKLAALFQLAEPLPISGTAKLNAKVSGSLNNLTGSGEFLVPEGKYRDIPFTAFQSSFTASPGKIKLVQGKLTIFGGQVAANGELNLQPLSRNISGDSTATTLPFAIPKFTLALKAENLMLDKISVEPQELGATPLLTGKVNGVLQVSGNLDDRDTWLGSGRFNWMDGKYQTFSITTAELGVVLEKGMVNIQRLHAENSDAQAEGTGFIRLKNSEIHLQCNLTMHRMDAVNRMFNFPGSGLTGHGTAEIVFDGTLSAPLISGKFAIADGTLADMRFTALEGQLSLQSPLSDASRGGRDEFVFHLEGLQWGEGWNLNGDAKLKLLPQHRAELVSAVLKSGVSQLTCSGEIDFANNQTHLVFSGKEINLADFPQIQKAIPKITAQLDLTGTITGALNHPVISGMVSVNSVLANEQPLPKLNGTFTYTAAQKQTGFDISGAGYFVHGDILFAGGGPDMQIQVTAQSGALKLLAAGFRLPNIFESGTFNGTGTISGKGTNLTISGNFRQLEILTPDSANKIILTEGAYSGKIVGKSGAFQFAAGALKTFKSAPHHKNGKAELDALLASLESIKGDLSWNEQVQVDGRLTAVRGTFSSVPFTGLNSRVNYQSGRLTITDSRLVTGGGTASLSGLVNWNPKPFTYQFTTKAQNVQLQPVLRSLPGMERLYDSSGILDATLSCTGSGTELDALAGKGDLAIKEITFLGRKIDAVTASIEIAHQQLKITAAELLRNKTTASLTGWIAQDQHLNITAIGNTDDLKLWLPQAKGAAQFQLTWTNTLQKPVLSGFLASTSGGYAQISWDKAEAVVKLIDKLQGTIEFSGERIMFGTQRFDRATATIKLNDPEIELAQLTVFQKEGSSQAIGKMNLTSGEMALNIEGKKLDLMSLLFWGTPDPWWESGEVYFQGEFTGNYKQHYATTRIKQLQIVSKQKIAGFPKPVLINEQEILITWQNQQITIPATKFTDGTGTFTIDGNILLTADSHLKTYNFLLKGENIILPVLRGLNALYSPQLTLKGDRTGANLTGDFRIAKADIDGPIMFAPLPSNSSKPVVVNTINKSPLVLDLMFRAEDKLHLKIQMLDVDGKGWIKLAGPANEPQISYEFQSVGGVVLFRGYKFQITKADAKPIESSGFNPLMDFYAQKRIRTTDVYLRFYGTMQDYEITLTSDPPMEQSDIMALLATGRTTEELRTAAGTGSERVAYGLAAGYIGEEILNTVGSPIVKAVGIDRVGVDYEASNEPRLKIEKDLGKRISVSYSMEVTKYPDPQAKVELGLGKNLSLIGTAGTNSLTQTATGAVDLELKFRTK